MAYVDLPFDVCPFLGGAESLHELLEASRVGRGEFETCREVDVASCSDSLRASNAGSGRNFVDVGGNALGTRRAERCHREPHTEPSAPDHRGLEVAQIDAGRDLVVRAPDVALQRSEVHDLAVVPHVPVIGERLIGQDDAQVGAVRGLEVLES